MLMIVFAYYQRVSPRFSQPQEKTDRQATTCVQCSSLVDVDGLFLETVMGFRTFDRNNKLLPLISWRTHGDTGKKIAMSVCLLYK